VGEIHIHFGQPQQRRPGPFGSKGCIWFALAVMVAAAVFLGGFDFSKFLGGGTKADAAPATGSTQQKLLAAASKYDDLGYSWGGGHNPERWVASYKAGHRPGLDCSGLVDVAVYVVTGGKINSSQVAEGFQHDKHWKNLSISSAAAGDIVWRNPGHRGPIAHVGIVIDNDASGKKVKIIEAKTSHAPYKDQIRVATYPYSDFQGASRLNFKG